MAQFSIAQLKARSFGPFRDIDVKFSPGLNVLIGDNATGKSQLLKLAYSCTKALKDTPSLTKKDLSTAVASKLKGTLRPDSLGRLTHRAQGRSRSEVMVKYSQIRKPLKFSFASQARREVAIDSVPDHELTDEPVYLPPHELLTLSSNFISLYDNYETGFDETWRDTNELLLRPALRGARMRQAAKLLEPFADLLQDGSVRESNGRFYLHQPGVGNLEAPLLAEGHRKLAMIVRLISNGMLLEGGYLFWDEPEANLNPASQNAVSNALVHLAAAGAQVFVATHSMFLLRELQMATENNSITPRYIGLKRETHDAEDSSTAAVSAQTADDLDDIEPIAALEAEAGQANRYLSWAP